MADPVRCIILYLIDDVNVIVLLRLARTMAIDQLASREFLR